MKENMVRTLLAILICVSLLLCMIACGDKERKPGENGTQGDQLQTQEPTDTLGSQASSEEGEDTELVTAGFSKNY